MQILTYKRTHIGDPDREGRFGINDCMGRIRSFQYDAVIGVGGNGYEPRKFKINGKITWVGVNPNRRNGGRSRRAEVVTFEHFILFDDRGPNLHDLAPALALKIFSGRRFVLNSYSEQEKAEAIFIIEWAFKQSSVNTGAPTKVVRGTYRRAAREQTERKFRCIKTPNTSFHRTAFGGC